MQRMLVCGLVVGAMALTGCQNKSKKDMAEVPPPPPTEPMLMPEPMPVPMPAPAAAAPAPAPASGGAMAGGTYVVQKGDTLFSIARKVYGSASRWKDIAAANHLSDANKITVGQKLVLP